MLIIKFLHDPSYSPFLPSLNNHVLAATTWKVQSISSGIAFLLHRFGLRFPTLLLKTIFLILQYIPGVKWIVLLLLLPLLIIFLGILCLLLLYGPFDQVKILLFLIIKTYPYKWYDKKTLTVPWNSSSLVLYLYLLLSISLTFIYHGHLPYTLLLLST